MRLDSASINACRPWPGLNRLDLWALCLGWPLLACWCWFAGLGGYPTNDDPFYGRPAQILAEESRFQLVRQSGELSASSVAHVIIGGALTWLIGFSYHNLFLAVILQLWLAALAVYALARAAGSSRWFAFFWGSVFIANPLCFAHGFTFMTDAPATSWGVFSIFFFRRGLCESAHMKSAAKWLLCGSLAVGVAFWMRQTHVLFCGFPVAALTWLWMRGGLIGKNWWWGVVASVAPAAVAVLLFESGWLVFGDGFFGEEGRLHVVAPHGFNWYQNAINVYGVGILMGFLTLPVLPVLIGHYRESVQAQEASRIQSTAQLQSTAQRWSLIAAIGVVVLWLLPLVATQGRACLTSATGTVMANAHFGPIFLSDFEMPERWGDMGGVVWPNWMWAGLTVIAILNLGALISCLVPSIFDWLGKTRSDASNAAITFGLFATAVPMSLVILSVSTGVLDRYWMLLLPIVFAIVPELVGCVKWEYRWLTSGLSIAQLAMSIIFARDFLVWNQVRWQQVETWLSEGLKPEEIDGGRDINAWYRSAEDYETMPRQGDATQWWSGHAQMALAIGPREGWNEVGRLRWRAWATGGEHEIRLLSKEHRP